MEKNYKLFVLSEEVVCISDFHAKAEYRDQLIQELCKLLAPTRAEPGCIQYELVLDDQDQNFIRLIEKFRNKKVFDEHEEQPYIQNFLKNFMQKYCDSVTWREGKEIKKCL